MLTSKLLPTAGLPLVAQIESLEGSKTELRLKWLKNDTTVTSYRISGELESMGEWRRRTAALTKMSAMA